MLREQKVKQTLPDEEMLRLKVKCKRLFQDSDLDIKALSSFAVKEQNVDLDIKDSSSFALKDLSSSTVKHREALTLDTKNLTSSTLRDTKNSTLSTESLDIYSYSETSV